MKTLRFRSLTILGFLAFWGGSVAAAANISGTYSDKGSALSGSSSAVSLHALLSLEFQPEVGLADHANTEGVVILDEDGWLEIKTYTGSGTEISRTRWGPHNGFGHKDGKAVFRIEKSRNELYSFLLSSAADGAALEVAVYKVTPSALGPGAHPVGTYFFVKAD